MDNDPNKEVKHWGCYGIKGTGNPCHVTDRLPAK